MPGRHTEIKEPLAKQILKNPRRDGRLGGRRYERAVARGKLARHFRRAHTPEVWNWYTGIARARAVARTSVRAWWETLAVNRTRARLSPMRVARFASARLNTCSSIPNRRAASR